MSICTCISPFIGFFDDNVKGRPLLVPKTTNLVHICTPNDISNRKCV